MFGLATEAALAAFQQVRGLQIDGVADEVTWAALQEASWQLGDRHLYLRTPNLRGDDVAELQRLLGPLGFDPGRVDGIFGPLARRAVGEFQENAGLEPDGVCGYRTLEALRRIGGRLSDAHPVASVREHEVLRGLTPRLNRKRVVVGCFGGLDGIARTVSRQLRTGGASVAEVDQADGSGQAASANRFGADVYIGLAVAEATRVSYYEVPGFVSLGGRRLAQLLVERLFEIGLAPATARGMRHAVLRETRMPAVLVEVGPIAVVVGCAAEVAEAMSTALRRWVDTPVLPA